MKDFITGILGWFAVGFACTAGVYGGMKAVDAVEEKIREKKAEKAKNEVRQYADNDDYLE